MESEKGRYIHKKYFLHTKSLQFLISMYFIDWLSWTENDSKDRYLYELLVNTVGTEIDIRKRQQLFIIKDLITNISEVDSTTISS